MIVVLYVPTKYLWVFLKSSVFPSEDILGEIVMNVSGLKNILEPLVQRTGRFKESRIPFTLLRPHRNNDRSANYVNYTPANPMAGQADVLSAQNKPGIPCQQPPP